MRKLAQVFESDGAKVFQPGIKLKEKTREGSKVTKKYDEPRTRYRCVLESNKVDE